MTLYIDDAKPCSKRSKRRTHTSQKIKAIPMTQTSPLSRQLIDKVLVAISVLLCLMTFALFTQKAMAEKIVVPIGQQGKGSVLTPRLGMKKVDVEQQFGTAKQISGPVGSPPITTWEYDDFSVYFEYDVVLHTVVKHKPVASHP
ncbi:hypothetical protein [Marinibactrum halimedae]|uniref:Phosphodiesterase n=1 Tax=Marinibactrum halimedae TaxID=1444977 RepID=A0AA37TCJ3_9GAMM|nr:hypothetical protein [Marinibactrum halimedae]MCD9461075.1 hypothetical protein [Marinibactrum halimedae]GLS26742.1 hypothetical protein GCM10007877_24600 [Marinibactrum halimedae]